METDEMLFHAVFQLLIEFVEGQCSHLEKIQNPDPKETDEVIKRWHQTNLFKRWWNRKYWDEQLGMAHLRWASSLSDPTLPEDERNVSQGEAAARTLELYEWYKWERAKRPTSDDLVFTGQKFVDGGEDWWDDVQTEPSGITTSRFRQFTPEYYEFLNEDYSLDERNANEDTRRAQQVLEIRRALWT